MAKQIKIVGRVDRPCSRCKKNKRNGYDTLCKQCRVEYNAEYHAKHKDQKKRKKARHYGFTDAHSEGYAVRGLAARMTEW